MEPEERKINNKSSKNAPTSCSEYVLEGTRKSTSERLVWEVRANRLANCPRKCRQQKEQVTLHSILPGISKPRLTNLKWSVLRIPSLFCASRPVKGEPPADQRARTQKVVLVRVEIF